MAATTRRSSTAPSVAELADRIQQLEQIQTTVARVLSRWIVRCTPGQGAATFTQILVNELHIATHEEAAAVEAWLTAHPGS